MYMIYMMNGCVRDKKELNMYMINVILLSRTCSIGCFNNNNTNNNMILRGVLYMARRKKDRRGYYKQTFTYNGQRYYVRSKDESELPAKIEEKKKELQERKENRTNPTIQSYYDEFTEIRRREIKEATIRGQIYQFRNIAEVIMLDGCKFGTMRIKDITRRDIEYARQSLLKSGKTPEYLNIIFAHLNHVFETATIDEIISRNPCKALKRLKRENKPVSETKHRALSVDETLLFLKTAQDRNSMYTNLFKVMLLTGMRIGEVSALHQTDISKDFIHVRRSITRDEIGQYIIGNDAKTQSGKRDIPLSDEVKKLIKEQVKQNNAVYGSGWSGPIFQSAEGTLLREYTVNREIRRICKAAEMEYFTCHAFRITFATRFIEQRPQDFKILSEIMGHKDISITMNLYTRVMQDSKIAAMKGIKIKTS